MHHEPILDLSLPFLVSDAGSPGEAEAPQHPAEHHAHLHQRQVLTGADRRAVREGYESGRVVLSRRRALAEPSFRQERLGRVEVTPVPMNTVGVKGDLRLLRDDAAHKRIGQNLLGQSIRRRSPYSFPRTLVPLPFSTERCEPLGTGGWRRRVSLLLEWQKKKKSY